VADVEDALHLFVERFGLVVELRGSSSRRVPGRSFEAAFAHGCLLAGVSG
jgi:hypothetical protein